MLDPAVVARLSHLDVRARLVVEGFIAGMHRSPFHGFSVEFAEHRPYMPGDPLKNLDWKVWARSDRYLVKQYTEETNLRCHLLVDLSGSMGFRSARAVMSKLEYAQSLSAALAYLMLHQQDAVGLLLFAAMSYTAVLKKSATADEPLHALAAYVRTFYGDFRLNPDHPPLWGYWAMLPQSRSSLKINFDSADWKSLTSFMWSGAKFTTQTQHSKIEIQEVAPDGSLLKSHRSETRQRWVSPNELELLLRLAGFGRWTLYGDFDRRPLDGQSRQMLTFAWNEPS